ncbi:hypothetical protein SKAU_G00026080 [Synaphobranchus kaupii]|uniref:Uncharacterized protein n=1 Tax=Synaphobranchus kaupii TaxID=118154 RepID=A0A9Q1GCU0_SYNKA|nr:hypothetical protein SKAU_G00026080 [Synaphobranchus kaupii]
MNWVGGSRSRCMLKNDARKQMIAKMEPLDYVAITAPHDVIFFEFFEKKKMQKRTEHLGLAADPQGAATGSIDLVTLFIVNQIAAKKDDKNSNKVTHLSHRKGAQWSMNEATLELPMSPCSPSRLCLMESQPQYSVQRKRKHHLSELHNNRQLSPVLESNFSDCSASDYRHGISNTFSPFSSATSGSLGGSFPAGQRGEFKPFCRPREVREANPWSAMSHGSQLKVHYPPVSTVHFGSTESSFISTQKSRGHALETCFLSLSKDEEKDQETALMDFDSATTFDKRKIRISFQEEAPQNYMLIGDPNESQNRHQEADFLSQPVGSVACGGHGQVSVKSCGSVWSSPCDGLLSSGSDSVGSRGVEGDQFVPSRLQPGTTHTRETWTGQESQPYQTREIGTQTDSISLCHTYDASTQCSPRKEGKVSTSPSFGSQSCSPSVCHGKHNQATRGQCGSADELLEVDSHAGTPDSLREEVLLPQNKCGVAAQQNPLDALTGHQLHSGGPEHLYRPETMTKNWKHSAPTLKHIYINEPQVRDELRKEQTNGGQRQVKWVEIYDYPTQHPVENMAKREGEDLITESTLMKKGSEETATLQEIADILLMMKQKNKFQ